MFLEANSSSGMRALVSTIRAHMAEQLGQRKAPRRAPTPDSVALWFADHDSPGGRELLLDRRAGLARPAARRVGGGADGGWGDGVSEQSVRGFDLDTSLGGPVPVRTDPQTSANWMSTHLHMLQKQPELNMVFRYRRARSSKSTRLASAEVEEKSSCSNHPLRRHPRPSFGFEPLTAA